MQGARVGVLRYLKRNPEDKRVELTSVGRNHQHRISAQNKEELSSSPRNTKMDWLAQGAGGQLSAGVEGILSRAVRHRMWGQTRQHVRSHWRALLPRFLGSSDKFFLPHTEEALLRAGNHRWSRKILLLTQAFAGGCPYSSVDEVTCLELKDRREGSQDLSRPHSSRIPG